MPRVSRPHRDVTRTGDPKWRRPRGYAVTLPHEVASSWSTISGRSAGVAPGPAMMSAFIEMPDNVAPAESPVAASNDDSGIDTVTALPDVDPVNEPPRSLKLASTRCAVVIT